MSNFYEKVTKTERVLNIIRKTIIYFFLALWAIMIIFPFYFMILTSFKTSSEYNAELVPKLYSIHPTFENYINVFGKIGIGAKEVSLWKVMLNTLIYAVLTTTLMLGVVILAAFAFARLDFKGKNLLFTFFLSLMIIPNELVIITNYITIVHLDWRNTFIGLIAPSVMSIFYIYFLRQTFMQVPDEIYNSAKIDGASDFKYMWKVLVPIAKPTIVSIIILKFIECWNAFAWPRLITTNPDYFLVSNAIQEIQSSGFGRANITAMMGAVVVVSLPLIILFVAFRKQIMAGVSRSGLKG